MTMNYMNGRLSEDAGLVSAELTGLFLATSQGGTYVQGMKKLLLNSIVVVSMLREQQKPEPGPREDSILARAGLRRELLAEGFTVLAACFRHSTSVHSRMVLPNMDSKTSKLTRYLKKVSGMRHKLLKQPAPQHDKQRGNEPPFRLLDLPPEIRAQILSELLCDDVPIFHGPKPDHMRAGDWKRIVPANEPRSRVLYPDILRVCKQLHEEGDPLLYSNTVRCVIDYDDDRPLYTVPTLVCPHYPQQDSYKSFVVDAYPASLRKRLRKFHCDISFKRESFRGTVSKNISLQHYVTKLVEFLEEHKNVQHLSFRLRIPQLSNRPDTSYEVVRRQLLQPFTYLRGRSSIVVDGVHDHLTARLQLITTDQPALHMHRIFAVLLKGVREIMETISYRRLENLDYAKPISELMRECEDATNEGLESEFLAARQRVVSLMTMLQLLSNNDMLGVVRKELPARNRGPFLLPGPGLEDVRATFDGTGCSKIDNVIWQYEAAFGVTPRSE